MPPIVSPTSRSSLYAGTTTATRFPSSIGATLQRPPAGHAVDGVGSADARVRADDVVSPLGAGDRRRIRRVGGGGAAPPRRGGGRRRAGRLPRVRVRRRRRDPVDAEEPALARAAPLAGVSPELQAGGGAGGGWRG